MRKALVALWCTALSVGAAGLVGGAGGGGCAASGTHRDGEAMAAGSLAELAWLTGTWRQRTGNGFVEETWTAADADTMFGISRTVKEPGGKTAFFESLRVERDESGMALLAAPLGRHPATRFALVSLGGRRAVFENPEHDFPTRIVYERRGDELIGRIEGVQNGKERAEEWRYERVK